MGVRVHSPDITDIPVRRSLLYLVAIMDWASRYVLAWRLSNTLVASFCTDALEEAWERYGRPEIFNPTFPIWLPQTGHILHLLDCS